VALWPGSAVHAQRTFESPRFEDFEYTPLPHTKEFPMCWLGNGLTVAQEENKSTTSYLDTVDIPPAINNIERAIGANGANGVKHKAKYFGGDQVQVDGDISKVHLNGDGQVQHIEIAVAQISV
jgi:hypothetical protein